MGLDYIRSRTGKPWKKRWDRGLDRMKLNSLFDLEITELESVVTVQILNGVRLRPGDELIAEINRNNLIISQGLRAVGRIVNPPKKLSTAIVLQGGYSTAKVKRVGVFGDTAEVAIQ